MLHASATIVCGNNITLCLNNDGNVFSFGYSSKGVHGHKEVNVFPPKIISSLNHIISISAGYDHSVCLDNDGNVFTFGKNKYGQLGIGNNEESYNSPQLISSLKDVEFIECGAFHVFCKILNNEIYCWGSNYYGQLGLGNNDNQNTPILCSSLLKEDIVDIKCGYFHTLVLTSNGDVLYCGDDNNKQLGRETDNYSPSFQKIEDLSEITRIECGSAHSLCIDVYNNLYVFGINGDGQLGLGDTEDRVKPIKHPSLSNIIDISKGGFHTFVKTANNEIYAFGSNDCSQLGIEAENRNQITPIRVFEDDEDIWYSKIKSKAKSARSIL